jgi:hypothetical protein
MTTPLQPQEYAGTLQRTEWCLGLAEATITTLTDAEFIGQVGRDVRPLSAGMSGPEAPPPQGARRAGRPRGHSRGNRRGTRG